MPIHPGVKMGTGELPWKGWGVTLRWFWFWVRGSHQCPTLDELLGGGVPCDQLVSLAGVSSNTPSRLMDMETRISSVWVDHLAGVQTLPWEFMITRKFFDRQIKLHESLGRIHLCWSFTFVLLWSIKWVTEWDTKGLLQIKDDYYNCLHFQKIVLINCKDKTVTNLTSGESAFLIMLTKPKREARGP